MSDVQHAYFQLIPRYEQEISVRAPVDEILVWFMDRFAPNLEHSFSVPCTSKDF